jgi:hypothetical protein
MANIARLGVALGLNSAEFVTGIDAASRKLDQFATAAVGAAKNAVLAFGAALSVATYQAISYADELADVAAANDIAIDSIIKLTNALENSGGKGANAGKMIASFTDFVDKAAKGSFEGQKTFSDLGITLKDIGSLSTQQLLLKTTQAIADMEDPLTRNARAADAFGKAAKGVDMVEFAKGLREGKGATLEQEQAIKDAAEAFDTFRSIGRDIALLILTSIGPQLKAVANYMKSASSETSAFGVVFGSVFKTIAHGMSDLAFINKGFADDIGHAIKSLESLTLYLMTGQLTKGFEKFAQDVKEYNAKRKQARAELDAFQKELLGTETKASRMGAGFLDPRIVTEDERPLREVTPGIDPKAAAAKAAAKAAADKAAAEAKKLLTEFNNLWQDLEKQKQDAIKKQQDLVMKGYEAEQNDRNETRIAQAGQQGLFAQGNALYAQRQGQQIILLAREQEMFMLQQKSTFLKAEDLQQEKEILQQQYNHIDAMQAIDAQSDLEEKDKILARERELKFNELALENIRERGRVLRSQKDGGLIEGFLFRMDTFGKNMETSFEAGGKAFDSLMGSMSKALDEFVTTGKLNFGDFAKSIIKDMLAIQLRASANNLFAMIGKSLFSSPVSLAEPLFGARADGGPVDSGGAYMVGERGPELFVPRSAGAIVPNHSMAMMGGSTNITNYNIQAIDTKSFEDRILGSSKAVWAANAYGAKNLSLGRGRT